MKSIFKKIALVMALAMVVTMLPAKPVSAADPADNLYVRKSCMLYLDGDATETYGAQAWATKKAKSDAWKTNGYSVTFKSDDESIATVGKTKGLITAVGVGTTTVTATFSKEGAEDIVESFPVTVKRNAVAIRLDDASQEAIKDLTVGSTVTLKGVPTDADGNEGEQYVSDYIKFKVENPEDTEVLTVDPKTGELKALAAGKAIVKVYTHQYEYSTETKNYKISYTTTHSDEVEVKVAVPTVTSAKLESVTKVVLDVENVTADDLKDLQITNANGVPQNISFKDPVLSEDKTQITVEHRSGLANGDVLNFFFGDQEAVKLDVKIGELKQVVLDGPLVVTAYDYNGTEIKIRCLDEYGTELIVPTADITYTVEGSQFTQIADGKIFIYDEIGTVVKLTATYNSGRLNEKNEWETITIHSNPINITAVKAADVTVKNIQYNLKAESYNTNPITIYMNEAAQIFTEVVLSNDEKVYSVDSKISFESLNPEILLVDAATGILTPVKAGATGILIKYDDGNTAKMSVVASVTVKDAKKLDKVVPNQPTVVISNATGVETKTITFTGKDQYGNDFGTAINKVELLTAPTKDSKGNFVDSLGWSAVTSGMNLTVAGAGQPAGTYTYRVTVDSNVNTVVSVVVRGSSATDVTKAASYKVVAVASDNVEVNSNTAGTATYTFKIVALDSAGVAFANVTEDITDVVVKIGSKEYKQADLDEDGGVFTVNLASVVSGSAVTVSGGAITGTLDSATNVSNSNGQYTVSEGNVTITAKVLNRVAVPFNTGNVSIKKDVPGVTVKDTLVTCGTGKEVVEAGIIGQLKLSDENKYQILSIDALNSSLNNAGTSIVFVKTVRVAEKRDDGSIVVHVVTLNASFRVTVQ